MNVREDTVQLPDGSILDEYYVVEYPDWACVLCLDESGHVILTEQYRHGTQRVCLELPAGVIEEDEAPEDAAKRELLEETGYRSSDWTFLGRCAPNPGKDTSYAYLFLARNAVNEQPQNLDASESIAVRRITPAEIKRLAHSMQMIHGIHLATVFLAVSRGIL